MKLVGNALNGNYFRELIEQADSDALEAIYASVAYVTKMDEIFDLARKRQVPLRLCALLDPVGFPSQGVLKRFLDDSPASWQLFLTSSHFHPKITWFRGVGAYIGSANYSDAGWYSNLECGVWIPRNDLLRNGWEEELNSMFEAIVGRCVPAAKEHLEAAKQLVGMRQRMLGDRQGEFLSQAQTLLSSLPGQESPILAATAKRKGGTARAVFVRQWHQTLTLLRKLQAEVVKYPWPSWIAKGAHPAIVQDQATDHYYDEHVRGEGDAFGVVQKLHEQNKSDPDGAVRDVFEAWSNYKGDDWTIRAVNTDPIELNERLSRDSLQKLDEESLARIMWLAHAPRAHARQISNQELGLAPEVSLSWEERCQVYAGYLSKQLSQGGKTIGDLLLYVLWGDNQEREVAERIWTGVHDPFWSIPHIGENILGELVGFARPDEFPPRNARAVKTLIALGFEGISFV